MLKLIEMHFKGIYQIAILSGKEDYAVLQISGREIFKEINDLISVGKINI